MIPARRSIGWYGSVAVPRATSWSGIDSTQLLLEKPGGVLFQVDFVLKGLCPRLLGAFVVAGGDFEDFVGLKKLMRVTGIAVFAAEFTAAVGVDGPLEREVALADGPVQDRTGAHGTELDLMTVVGVGRLSGKAGHTDRGGRKDGKEGRDGLS